MININITNGKQTMKFYYHTLKNMEPRYGNSYATSYYQINVKERQKLKEFIEQIIMDIALCHSSDTLYYQFIDQPLSGNFRKTKGKPNYTPLEIITDLNSQLNAGKDVPSGMLGRWQRLFKNTEWDIDMIPRRKKGKAELMKYSELFGDKDD